jgi:hypothetical protein
LAERKARDQRTLGAGIVTVVKVINRFVAVVQRSFFDAFEAEDLGVEIGVFLGSV